MTLAITVWSYDGGCTGLATLARLTQLVLMAAFSLTDWTDESEDLTPHQWRWIGR